MPAEAFWRVKTLAEMSVAEWESLCDGCAQCCRVKLEDEETGEIGVTDVVCRLLDVESCRCGDYVHRQIVVPDCISFGADQVLALRWLPETCAYRLVALGRDLPSWHPLVSGDPETVHLARRSVQGRVVSEAFVHPDEIESRIVRWIDPPAVAR